MRELCLASFDFLMRGRFMVVLRLRTNSTMDVCKAPQQLLPLAGLRLSTATLNIINAEALNDCDHFCAIGPDPSNAPLGGSTAYRLYGPNDHR